MDNRVCRMYRQTNRWQMPKDFGCTNLLRDLQLMLRVFVERLEIVTSLLQGRLFLEQCETVLRRLYLFSGRQVELAWQSLDLGPQLLDPDPVVDGGGHCCLRRLRDSDNDDGDDDDGDTLLCAPRCRYSSCFPSSSASSSTTTTTPPSPPTLPPAVRRYRDWNEWMPPVIAWPECRHILRLIADLGRAAPLSMDSASRCFLFFLSHPVCKHHQFW